MGLKEKINAGCKALKDWISANKAATAITAGVLVVGFGAAVALGAGFLPFQADAESGETVLSTGELSGEDLAAAYEPNQLRGELIGQPVLDALWESLEAEYARETTTEEETTEETTEEETTRKEVVEIPPVVVAPVDDKEDEQPQDDADKGVSEEVDISDIINDDTYENAGVSYGIDVSKWQGGSIDWAKVAESGVEFAMIRVGYRGNQTGEIMMDPYFQRNIKGALANGIKVGVYFYSQSIDEEEAIVEAAWVVNVIQNYQITYPVVFDYEGIGENRIKDVDKTQRSKNAMAFLNYIRSAGYTPMMYASKNGYKNNWDLTIIKNCKFWLAHYTSGGLSTPSDYTGTYDMWQYTSKGTVPGIPGNVDMNIAYFTYSNTPDPVIGTVTYIVTDDAGAPVTGATVSMKGEMTRKTLTAVTDDKGNAVFENVVVDGYGVSVSQIPDGYKSGSGSSLTIEFGKAETSYNGSLRLDRTTCSGVSFTVVDENGQMVPGVTLTLKGTSRIGATAVELTAVTDESGRAEFKNVLLGTYEVYTTAAPQGYELLENIKKETVELTSSSAVSGKASLSVKTSEIKPSESESGTAPSGSEETTKADESTGGGTDPSESSSSAEATTSAETTKTDDTAASGQ